MPLLGFCDGLVLHGRAALARPHRVDAVGERREQRWAGRSRLNDDARADLHNRFAREIVNEPIAADGIMSDVMTLCESVLVSVVVGRFSSATT